MDTKANLQLVFSSSNPRPIINSWRFSRSDFHGTPPSPSHFSVQDNPKFIRHGIDKRCPCCALTNRDIFKKLNNFLHNKKPKTTVFVILCLSMIKILVSIFTNITSNTKWINQLLPQILIILFISKEQRFLLQILNYSIFHRILYNKTNISSIILLLTLRKIL